MMSKDDFKAFLKANGYTMKDEYVFERFWLSHWDSIYFWENGYVFLNRRYRDGDRWALVRDFIIRDIENKSQEYIETLLIDNFMIGEESLSDETVLDDDEENEGYDLSESKMTAGDFVKTPMVNNGNWAFFDMRSGESGQWIVISEVKYKAMRNFDLVVFSGQGVSRTFRATDIVRICKVKDR